MLLACALTLASSVAFANNNTGCGLGSVVIKNQDSTFKQVIASTTNGTSGSQTFGITSGTSECAKPTNFVSNGQLNEFVASNMDGLATDIANGHGEIVNTLAVMMDVQDKAAFIAALQANFSEIYTSDTVNSANVIDRITAIVG
jgi:predicted nucleic-acid-binding Zn-ribbon protein